MADPIFQSSSGPFTGRNQEEQTPVTDLDQVRLGNKYNGTLGTVNGDTIRRVLREAAVKHYLADQTYALNDFVLSGGVLYKSLQNSNTGNTPSSSPTFWEEFSGGGSSLELQAGSNVTFSGTGTPGDPLIISSANNSYTVTTLNVIDSVYNGPFTNKVGYYLLKTTTAAPANTRLSLNKAVLADVGRMIIIKTEKDAGATYQNQLLGSATPDLLYQGTYQSNLFLNSTESYTTWLVMGIERPGLPGEYAWSVSKLTGGVAADGSETEIQAGTDITVSGTGTSGDPYIINYSGVGGGGSTVLQKASLALAPQSVTAYVKYYGITSPSLTLESPGVYRITFPADNDAVSARFEFMPASTDAGTITLQLVDEGGENLFPNLTIINKDSNLVVDYNQIGLPATAISNPVAGQVNVVQEAANGFGSGARFLLQFT